MTLISESGFAKLDLLIQKFIPMDTQTQKNIDSETIS
jgi:hypothetical protein